MSGPFRLDVDPDGCRQTGSGIRRTAADLTTLRGQGLQAAAVLEGGWTGGAADSVLAQLDSLVALVARFEPLMDAAAAAVDAFAEQASVAVDVTVPDLNRRWQAAQDAHADALQAAAAWSRQQSSQLSPLPDGTLDHEARRAVELTAAGRRSGALHDRTVAEGRLTADFEQLEADLGAAARRMGTALQQAVVAPVDRPTLDAVRAGAGPEVAAVVISSLVEDLPLLVGQMTTEGVDGLLDRLAELAGTGDLSPDWVDGLGRRPGESLDDWVVRVQAEAWTLLPGMAGREDEVTRLLKMLGTAGDLAVSSVGTVLALVALNRLRAPEALAQAPAAFSWLARGARLPGVGQLAAPLDLARNGATQLAARYPWLSTVVTRSGPVVDLLWGAGAEGGRRAALAAGNRNLITVFRAADDGARLATTARAAGLMRGVGVVGGAAATLYSAGNVISQGNMAEAFQREGAGYVADWGELGFNASLTALTIAPGPWTLGAVAVTGLVWGTAELVDNWDEVTETVGEGVEWVGDRAEDLADLGGDLLEAGGDVLSDVGSALNPFD